MKGVVAQKDWRWHAKKAVVQRDGRQHVQREQSYRRTKDVQHVKGIVAQKEWRQHVKKAVTQTGEQPQSERRQHVKRAVVPRDRRRLICEESCTEKGEKM